MNLRSGVASLGFLLLVLLATPVGATRFVALTIEQLAARAEVVVHGTVRAVEALRAPDGRVFSRAEFDVHDVWKGKLDRVGCRVVWGGGVLGETRVEAAGQVDYAVGDEVVVFLGRGPGDDWVTVGLVQGRFRVRREPGSGRRWVHGLFWGGPEAGTGARPQGMRWPADRPLDFEELKRRTQEVSR